VNIDQRIACEILLFTFRVVQTGFLTRYAKYIFASSLGLYYGLLILGQISEINRIVSKEYSKTAGSRKPSIAFITLRADEFVSHGHDKVEFPDVSIRIASDYCNSIETTVMVLSTLKCFYLLQTECKPTNKSTSFGSKDYQQKSSRNIDALPYHMFSCRTIYILY
jgi:hypothetical protein